MYPDLDLHVVLFELEERHHRADMHRLARSCEARPAEGFRRALGNAVLRLGATVSGDDRRLDSSVASSS